MPLSESIDLNKTALARIVAGLFALLGLTAGAVLGRIPRKLHSAVLKVLRPAESAVRRLIVIVARSVKVKTPPPRPWPAGLVRAGLVRSELSHEESGKTHLAFKLFDPRQRFFRKPPRPKNEPRARPSITFFGNGDPRRIFLGREPPPPRPRDGLETAAHLVRRLGALKAALDNLPRQALRLARALARRQTSPRLKLQGPLRPGPAPGARKQPVEEIHRVLERCHWLARDALAPDTS